MSGSSGVRRVLVIDVGGRRVKIRLGAGEEVRKRDSGADFSAAQMAEVVLELAEGWRFDAISMGFPGPVRDGRPAAEPVNLGAGWIAFDYEGAFQRPVKIVNDAAMQALGSYDGGRMLFLGLGTGLGSAMVLDGIVQSMELAHLPYRKERTFEDYVGRRGLDRRGRKKWSSSVEDIVARLSAALLPDYVVLGGGNAKKLEALPERSRLGSNLNAFVGGQRLWGHDTSDRDADAPA